MPYHQEPFYSELSHPYILRQGVLAHLRSYRTMPLCPVLEGPHERKKSLLAL